MLSHQIPVACLVSTPGGHRIKSGESSTADEGRDGLEVMGIWKEIDELERVDLETALHKQARIPRESGGIAGDIVQALNRTRQKALAEGPWKTAARRVDDNDIVTIEGKGLGEGGGVLLDEAHVPNVPNVPNVLMSGSFRIGPGVRERS